MIPSRALDTYRKQATRHWGRKRKPAKRRVIGFFKISPDINELATKARNNLFNREDLVSMNSQWIGPDGQPHPEIGANVSTEQMRANGFELNPKFNPMLYRGIVQTLNSLPPETFKFYPWVVKQMKIDHGESWRDRRHLTDILRQAWQHMEYLRSQPANSPNKAPIPDINQLTFPQLEEWVYGRNSTGIDVRPGYQWDYQEGEPSGDKEPFPNSELEENPIDYHHPAQGKKWDVGNGWYVWPVWTEQDLKQEGDLMGHCVGGYCHNVQSGQTTIFSLRDPKGEPHATIELEPINGHDFKLIQVQGKQNSDPAPEYKQMVKNFFGQLFDAGFNIDQRIEITDLYELEQYNDGYLSNGEEYGINSDVTVDLDSIARELVDQAVENYSNRSELDGLQKLVDDGHVRSQDVSNEINYYANEKIEEKQQELEYEWKQEKQRIWEEWNDAKEAAEQDHYDQFDEGEEPEEFEYPTFEEYLEENYPEEYEKEYYGFETAAEDEMPEVADLKYRFGSVQKWAIQPSPITINVIPYNFNGESEPTQVYEAVVNGEVVAQLHVTVEEDKWRISNVWTSPEYQRQGIATQLLQYATDDLEDKIHHDRSHMSPEGLKWRKTLPEHLAYTPDQGGGDPRSWKMPTLNNDVLPMSPTPLGPCERCGDGMVRDAEGVYCPSCGHRTNPDVQNGRIDMYAPLGEGIGEGPYDTMSKRKPSYWALEGSNLPWWLPSKTAADVYQLAQEAYKKLWQREDMAKLWEQMAKFESIASEYGIADNAEGLYLLERIFPWSGVPDGEPPLFRTNMRSRGYSDDTITQAIEHASEMKPFYRDYLIARKFEDVLTSLESNYPGSYKIWPWAIKQLKNKMKEENLYNDLANLKNRQWNHFTDIVGQVGELLTNLRQHNRIPQGFDLNQMNWDQAEQWLQEYNSQHIGEGWEKRDVVAKLPNGWTVEEVNTPEDLKREGELMGHCVGGYCNVVQNGTSKIFSLRDPNGGPHVTMEYKPLWDQTTDEGGPWQHDIWNPQGAKLRGYEILQIQGKGNGAPKPEYRKMISEFNQYLQGEGISVKWSGGAWRHDRGRDDRQIMDLRNQNTYDIQGTEGLHQLERDYDQNGGVTHFNTQLPDIPDEYGVNAPSGVPERYINLVQIHNATDEVLSDIFEGKITPEQYDEYGRKLIVAWYAFISQPYASQNPGAYAYSPKSPVDARSALVLYITQFVAKIMKDLNHRDVNPRWPQPQNSQFIKDAIQRMSDFQRSIGDRTGTEMLDWTRPNNGAVLPEKGTPAWFTEQTVGQQPAEYGENYFQDHHINIPDDEPGYHPEAKVATDRQVYMPYRFIVGKDGRIFGGRTIEHSALAEQYGLDRDPAWTEVARGEYDPDGSQTIAEFLNSPFGPEDLTNRVHQWVQTINDPDAPMPNGQVNYNRYRGGQGLPLWDRQQFQIGSKTATMEGWLRPGDIVLYDPIGTMESEKLLRSTERWKYLGQKSEVPDKDLAQTMEFMNEDGSIFQLPPSEVDRFFIMGYLRMEQPNTPGFSTAEEDYYRHASAKWSMPMTIPQQQRAWEALNANPKIVYEFPNGWSVRQAQSPEDVNAIGTLCRNCWQGYDNHFDIEPGSVYYREPEYYALFNTSGLPIVAFYIRPDPETDHPKIQMALGPRNRNLAPEEDEMLQEFADSQGYVNELHNVYRPEDTYLDVLRQRDMVGSWKYSVAGIPANYTKEDPLDLQGKQPVLQNMQVDWWKLPPVQQRQAIVNAFRATMLSPRLNLKNNAIMYQEFMDIPADESDPDVFEQHARDLKARWDRQGQGDLFDEVQPMGWEQVIPGKLIPGFWGNIRRLAALGPYADQLRQAALDDLNQNGGRGTLFRQEVLKLGIPGVGPKVASFAWLALNPMGSDLATIDVWMMRHLNQDAESPNTPAHYFDLENQLRDEKDQMYGPNTPLGQYQWGVWDKIRTPGYHQDHSPLRVYNPTPYTEVAWSPQYRAPRPQQLPEQNPEQQALFANRNKVEFYA